MIGVFICKIGWLVIRPTYFEMVMVMMMLLMMIVLIVFVVASMRI